MVSGLQTNLSRSTDGGSTDNVSILNPQTSTDPTAFISICNTIHNNPGLSYKTHTKLPFGFLRTYNFAGRGENGSSWDLSNIKNRNAMLDNDSAFSSVNYTRCWIGYLANTFQYFNKTCYYFNKTCNWTFIDDCPVYPSTPVLSPISSPSFTGNISLDWSSSLSNLSYSIYRSNSIITTLANTTMIASNITDTTYQDMNLTPGTYYYVIVAMSGDYNSQISNCESVTVFLPPLEPTNLNAIVGKNDITLTWESPSYNGGSSLLYYKIYRTNSFNGQFTMIGNSTTTSYIDHNAIERQTYYYKVSAVNIAGESSFSNIANAMLINKPSEPINLSAKLDANYITLTWESPIDNGGSAILHYNIYRSYSLNGQFTLIGNSTTTSYIDYNAIEGQTYYYKVSAVNIVGESSFSDIVNSIILLKPSNPTNLSGIVGTNYIELTWESPTDNGGSTIYYYNIYRSNSSNGQFTLIGNSATTSYKDYNLVDNQTYYYKVTAVNAVGESSFSNIANSIIQITSLKPSFDWLIFGIVAGVAFTVGVAASYVYYKRKPKKREIPFGTKEPVAVK